MFLPWDMLIWGHWIRFSWLLFNLCHLSTFGGMFTVFRGAYTAQWWGKISLFEVGVKGTRLNSQTSTAHWLLSTIIVTVTVHQETQHPARKELLATECSAHSALTRACTWGTNSQKVIQNSWCVHSDNSEHHYHSGDCTLLWPALHHVGLREQLISEECDRYSINQACFSMGPY